jgi:hypothetical protein
VDDNGEGISGNRYGVEIFLFSYQRPRGHANVGRMASDRLNSGCRSPSLDVNAVFWMLEHIFLSQQFRKGFNGGGSCNRNPRLGPLATHGQHDDQEDEKNPQENNFQFAIFNL